jgi:hypothetical protein
MHFCIRALAATIIDSPLLNLVQKGSYTEGKRLL